MFEFPFDFTMGAGVPSAPMAASASPMGPLPPMMPPAPLPEQIAQFLGSQNVTPQQFLQNPLAFAPKSAPTLGQSLQPSEDTGAGVAGVPLPQPRPAAAGPGAGAMAQGSESSLGDRLGKALQGVKAPAAPDVVKPSTPGASVPGPHGTIRGGNIAALLAALGAAAPRAPSVPMPLNPGGRY